MNNKEKILRDLEYLGGSITTIRTLTDKHKYEEQHQLFDEWIDIIYGIIDMIEEDYEECRRPLKNSLQ